MKASEFLIEIGAHDGAGAVTLRVSTCGYNTGPGDDPADTHYAEVVQDPGYFQRHLFGPGRTMGSSEVAYGEVLLANVDGQLDGWLDYGFDGRPVTIRRIASRRSSLASAAVILRGTVERLDSGNAWMGLRLRLYDRRLVLDRPLQTSRYAGTTLSTGPTADGNEDLKDQPKPLCFGRCFNVPGISVNPFDLIYQVHDGAIAAISVFDGGVPLTPAGDHANLAALQAASLLPGRYATCLALGLFRLGATPEYKVTADVDEGADAAARRPGAVALRMLARMGLSGSDVASASFAALDAAAPYQVGLYLADDRTGGEALGQVLASVGGWIIPDADNAFSVGRFTGAGTPAATIDMDDILADDGAGIELQANPDTEGGIPVWRVVLRYCPAFEVQDDAVMGGCVAVSRRGAVDKPWREVVAEDAGIKIKHLLAGELVVETYLVDADAAAAEAMRLLGLYGVRRDVLALAVPQVAAQALPPGASANVVLPRFGYGAGRAMAVIGRNEDFRNERVTLTLWG